jgi:hypothetical protein
MPDATFVAYVPRTLRERLRSALLGEDTGALKWEEKKVYGGSDFYISGPPALARKAHFYVQEWLCGNK